MLHDICSILIEEMRLDMEIKRHLESMSEPNDTMYVEIDGMHRFTRRGDDWLKFREDLIELIEQTISEDLAKNFAEASEDWIPDTESEYR